MKINVDVIHGQKNLDAFMHAADVFSQSKQLGIHECYTVSGGDIKIHELVTNLKNAFEKAGRNVVFVGIRDIDGNIFDFPAPYIRPNTNSISNGHQWGLFKDVLESLGYSVENDEHMCVTNAIRYEKYSRSEVEQETVKSEQMVEKSTRLPFKKKTASKRGSRI